MNKKILWGSIVSVVILVLVSFTSVVGYNNVESDIQSSPLFNIRSSRAIDGDSGDFSCEYVGMGIATFITFPKRDEKYAIAQKIMDLIDKMDNDEIEDLLFQIKSKSDGLKNKYLLINNRDSLIITIGHWWCVLLVIIVTIFSVPYYLLLSLINTKLEKIRQTYGLCSVFPPFCP